MTVYLDRIKYPWRGKMWTHMIADDLEQLHKFAENIGVKKHYFEKSSKYPHYDIDMMQVQKAIFHGAIFLEKREFIRIARKLADEYLEYKVQYELFN